LYTETCVVSRNGLPRMNARRLRRIRGVPGADRGASRTRHGLHRTARRLRRVRCAPGASLICCILRTRALATHPVVDLCVKETPCLSTTLTAVTSSPHLTSVLFQRVKISKISSFSNITLVTPLSESKRPDVRWPERHIAGISRLLQRTWLTLPAVLTRSFSIGSAIVPLQLCRQQGFS
jgi:hypothetical protein